MTISRSRISVVVPTLNEELHIGTMLTSLWQQNRPPDEIIVVDGGSTDATRDIASDLGAHVIHLPGVKEWPSMNHGVERSTGDIILFTGADVSFPPRVLSNIEKSFDRDPGLVGIGGPGIPVDPPALLGLEYSVYNAIRYLAARLPGSWKRFSTSTNCLAVRRVTFDRVGHFADGWNADGRMGRALMGEGRVRFFFLGVRARISSRRLDAMGFLAFNRHFLYTLENFLPNLRDWGPVQRSRILGAATHSNMRIKEGKQRTERPLSRTQRLRRRMLAPAFLSLVVAVALGTWAVSSTWEGQFASQRPRKGPVKHGTACAALEEAFAAANTRDPEALVGAIADAETRAFDALESTGTGFGKPEKVALRLGAITDGGGIPDDRLKSVRLQLSEIDDFCGSRNA